MTRINIQIKPILVVMIAVLMIFMIINNYKMQQLLADNHNNSSSHKQTQHQQDFSTCVNKSLDKLLNGYLNFSDPDPISHCYDQLFKGNISNGNGTQSNDRGNNNILDNSTFSNV